MKKRVFIVRGHSGSGKSAFVKELTNLINDNDNVVTLSAFDYFKGIEFDSDLVPESHEWALIKLEEYMKKQYKWIILHNTFTKSWELNKYVQLIEKYNYPYRIMRLESSHFSIEVPKEKIHYQMENYSPYGIDKKLKPKPVRKKIS